MKYSIEDYLLYNNIDTSGRRQAERIIQDTQTHSGWKFVQILKFRNASRFRNGKLTVLWSKEI